MDYRFHRKEQKIIAIDRKGASHKVGDVLDFGKDSILCFFVENDESLEAVGYYMLSTGKIRFVKGFDKEEKLCGLGIDYNGDIFYEGEIVHTKFSIEHSENNWSLISFYRSDVSYASTRALLFNEVGHCIKCLDNINIYDRNGQNGIVKIEEGYRQLDRVYGKSKRTIEVLYKIDFIRHLYYEFEEIPDCSCYAHSLFKGPYYISYLTCYITSEQKYEEKNIAICPKYAKNIKMVYDNAILESIEDIYCYAEGLSVLAKTKYSQDYTYSFCYHDDERGGYRSTHIQIKENWTYRRLQKTYCYLTMVSPYMQFTNPDTNERELFLYGDRILKNDSDFYIIHSSNISYANITKQTVVGMDIHFPYNSVLICTQNKVYNSKGEIITDFNENLPQDNHKFTIIDTWGLYIAGHYEGTNNYDFFTAEYTDNRINIDFVPAKCYIHKVGDKTLISLGSAKYNFILNHGVPYFAFDAVLNKFILYPGFKPTPPPINRNLEVDMEYNTLEDAFEGEVDLYDDWLNS